jgi:exopolysaccharide biosynthesis polyprenyl glycosylphosphotransferase
MSRPSLRGRRAEITDPPEPPRTVDAERTSNALNDAPDPGVRGQIKRRKGLRADWLPIALVAGDAIIAAASVVLGYSLRYRLGEKQTLDLGYYLAALPFVVVIYLFALAVNHQYSSWRGRNLVDQVLALYSGVGLAAVLILATISLFNLGVNYSRLSITYAVLLSAFFMTVERVLLREYETQMRRKGIGTENVLMVGSGVSAELIIQRMNMFPQYGFRVAGVLDEKRPLGTIVAGVSVIGRPPDLPRLAEELGADQVFIALPAGKRDQLLELVKLCEDQNLEFKIVPDLIELMSTRIDANAIDGLPLVGIRRSRLRGASAALKRAIDIIASSMAIVILSPLLILLAVLIRLGAPAAPVLFKQQRVGLHQRPFTIYKFRTMIPDAEAHTGPVVAKPGDSRVTAVGRFLRQASLDELPQLYNILRGDMSLVGPRPQPVFFDERYRDETPRYIERHSVRPGLTGWAEVNDLRGAAPIADRTLYDVYYIENWSLTLDFKIVLLTVFRVFFQRNAY